MSAIISEHFWACWWLALILGWGALSVIETFVKHKWPMDTVDDEDSTTERGAG